MMFFRTQERVDDRQATLLNEPNRLSQDLHVTLICGTVVIALSMVLIISRLLWQWRILKGNTKDENYEDIDCAQLDRASTPCNNCGPTDCGGDMPSAGSQMSRGHSPTSYLTTPMVSSGVGVALSAHKGQSSKIRSEPDVSRSPEGHWKRGLHQRNFCGKWEGVCQGTTTSSSDSLMKRAAPPDTAPSDTGLPDTAPSVRPPFSMTRTNKGDSPASCLTTHMLSSGVGVVFSAHKGQSSEGRSEPDVSQSPEGHWKRDLVVRLHQRHFLKKWEEVYQGSTTSTSDSMMKREAVTALSVTVPSGTAPPDTAPTDTAPSSSVRPPFSMTRTRTGDSPASYLTTPMVSSGVGVAFSAHKGQSSKGQSEPDVSRSPEGHLKCDLAVRVQWRHFRGKWERVYQGTTTSTSDSMMKRAAVTDQPVTAPSDTAPSDTAPSVRPPLSMTRTSRGDSSTSHLSTPMASRVVAVKAQSELNVPRSPEAHWKRGPELSLDRRLFREKLEGVYRGATTSTLNSLVKRQAVRAPSDTAPPVKPPLSVTRTSRGDSPASHLSTPMASSGLAVKAQSELNIPRSPEAHWKRGPELSLDRRLFREKLEGVYRGATTSTSESLVKRQAGTAPPVKPTLLMTRTSRGDSPANHLSTPMASRDSI